MKENQKVTQDKKVPEVATAEKTKNNSFNSKEETKNGETKKRVTPDQQNQGTKSNTPSTHKEGVMPKTTTTTADKKERKPEKSEEPGKNKNW